MEMHYVIGTDEAGYGPNLGPLVISATVWELPRRADDDDLWPLLDSIYATAANSPKHSGRLAIDDSKKLFQPGGTCARLELPLLSALMAQGRLPGCWEEVWDVLACDDTPRLADEFWWADATPDWPVACRSDEIDSWGKSVGEAFDTAGVRCVDIRSRVIVPSEFNDLVARFGNKATVLSLCTFELIRQAIGNLPSAPCSVICDRHSGRSSYRPLLQNVFDDCLIEVWEESAHCSRYRWGPKDRKTEIRFLTGGESHLPVALASMTSKYLRELAMSAFNSFWTRRIVGLRPTAGYPVDAKRFRLAVDEARAELSIDDDRFWRVR